MIIIQYYFLLFNNNITCNKLNYTYNNMSNITYPSVKTVDQEDDFHGTKVCINK